MIIVSPCHHCGHRLGCTVIFLSQNTIQSLTKCNKCNWNLFKLSDRIPKTMIFYSLQILLYINMHMNVDTPQGDRVISFCC